MATCQIPDCTEHYACALRAKGFSVSPAATPTRRNRIPTRHKANPAWERGVAGEHRADGSFMPYLGDGNRKIHVKEAGERRREIDARVHRLKNDPNVFAAERKPAAP